MAPSTNNHPPFMPAFSFDTQSGSMVPNSAASVMNAGIAQLIYEAERPRQPVVPEHKKQVMRQRALDSYLQQKGQTDGVVVKTGGMLKRLPTVASPQQVFIRTRGEPQTVTEGKRNLQKRNFEGSFMANVQQLVYGDLDDAIGQVAVRKEEILAKHAKNIGSRLLHGVARKKGEDRFSEKEKEYIYFPLGNALEELNKFFEERKVPVTVQSRAVWRTETFQEREIYMIFATREEQAKGPMNSWDGMLEAVFMNPKK